MNLDSIALTCPYCRNVVVQIAAGARPIQEQRVNCPSCNRASKLAHLKTDDGDTFQLHMRQISPNARVTTYGQKK